MSQHTLYLLSYLYWVMLLFVTTGSLVFAVLALKLHRQVFAICSAGALAAAMLLASVHAEAAPSVFPILLGMLALALSVVGGAPMAVFALKLATGNSVPQGTHGGILVETGSANRDPNATAAPRVVQEVLRGGLTIGILERFAVAGTIIAGFPEGVAVVIAIKGLGRYSELSEPESRERFIIGTLTSLIWASACSGLVIIASS